jgi:hypothetical protein
MKRKTMRISRSAIHQIGNPSHLGLRYDDSDSAFFICPADSKDLDAFEIPSNYWNGTHQQCEICRIALLKALQYRLGWVNGGKYYFEGAATMLDDIPTVVFVLSDGVRVR